MMEITNNRNAGFSLLEMIVSIMAAAILMLGIVAFISTSRATYSIVGTSAKLQEEALVVENTLKEIIQEALQYGCTTTSMDLSGATADIMCVKARDNESASGVSLYYLIFKKNDGEDIGKIYYKKENIPFNEPGNPSSGLQPDYQVTFETDAANNKIFNFVNSAEGLSIIESACNSSDSVYNLLAECVKSASVSTPLKALGVADAKGLLVNIKVTFEYNSEEYVASINSLSRNDDLLN